MSTGLADVVHGHHVGVGQGRRGAGLGLELVHESTIGLKPGGEHFDGHASVQAHLCRQPDPAHATTPQQFLQAIAGEVRGS